MSLPFDYDQLTVGEFGGTTPTSALLLPIILRGRTVAIVVAHRLHNDIKLADITELLPLASAAADALSQLRQAFPMAPLSARLAALGVMMDRIRRSF